MKFGLYDATGKVVSVGECPDADVQLQVQPGTSLFLGEIKFWDTVDVLTGERIIGTQPEPDYAERRRRSYPTVESQLGMLWDAMDRGDIPKADDWYYMIQSIKEQHPKPDDAHVAYQMPEA